MPIARPSSIERDGFAFQGLNDKIGHDRAVCRMHARPVGIENPCDLGFKPAIDDR